MEPSAPASFVRHVSNSHVPSAVRHRPILMFRRPRPKRPVLHVGRTVCRRALLKGRADVAGLDEPREHWTGRQATLAPNEQRADRPGNGFGKLVQSWIVGLGFEARHDGHAQVGVIVAIALGATRRRSSARRP